MTSMKETKLSEIIKEFVVNSSAHGLPNIYASNNSLHRLLWAILFFGGVGAAIWQISMIFKMYIGAPYHVDMELKFQTNLEFPSVTVCIVNPVRRTELESADADDQFRSFFDTNFVPPQNARPLPTTVSAAPETNSEESSTAGAGGGGPGSGGGGPGGGLPPGLPPGPLAPDSTTAEATTTESVTTSANAQTTTDIATEEIMSWDEKESREFFGTISEEYKLQQMLINILANKTLEERMELGHQLEDMLVSCEWKGYPCSPKNFTSFYHYKYGNCYTFNSNMYNNGGGLTTNRPGPLYGLALEMNVEQSEYMEGITATAGLKVVIHSPNRMPFPEDHGISISPGFETSIGVRVVDIGRLKKPWADCVKTLKSKAPFEDIYADIYKVGYSIETCERSCYQNEVIEQCGCASSKYPFSTNSSSVCIVSGDVADEEVADCVKEVDRMYLAGELGCSEYCPHGCNERTYIPTTSLNLWPALQYTNTLIQRVREANPEVNRAIKLAPNPTLFVTNNVARIQVYFQEFNYESIQQKPSYGIIDVLSDIGGQLGLWIGVSILTLCEMIQYVGVISAFLIRRMFRRGEGRVESSSPVETFNGKG